VQRLEDPPRIVVTGRVDDVRPFVRDAAVSVAPLRVARGLQNKVLEALALGVPVVASPEAFAGVQTVAGRDLLVAGDPDAFARAVVQVLRDAELRDRLGAAGRACVEANHDWDAQLDRLVTAGPSPVDGRTPFRARS
jgi:glycosyltransferase involved in cell wall biosynthesis